MKKRFIIFSIATALSVFISIYLVQRDFIKNESFSRSWEFYQNSNPKEYDFLIVGSSHLTMALSPLQLWNEYGITSYNMANFGQTMNESYWILKDALNRVKPQLVVLDAYGLFGEDEFVSVNSENFHSNVDAMPLSITKIEMINDIVNEDEKLYYYFPLSYVHGVWGINSYQKSIDTQHSFKGEGLDTRDVEQNVPIFDLSKIKENDLVSQNNSPSVAREYFCKSIELCKENGVDVLLLNTPSRYDDEKQAWTNSVNSIAEKYEVDFLEMNKLGYLFNWTTDFRDEGHVNSSGARKVTSYLGQYVLENFKIKIEHNDIQMGKWNREYEEYREYRLEQIKNQTDLDSFWALLYNCSYDFVIEITDQDVVRNEYYRSFLENLGVEENDFNISENIVLFVNGKTKDITVIRDFSSDEVYQTVLGEAKKEQIIEGGYKIILKNETIVEVSATQTLNHVVRFAIFDADRILYRGAFEKEESEVKKYNVYS